MNAQSSLLLATVILAALSIAAAGWVLGREKFRKLRRRRTQVKVKKAEAVLKDALLRQPTGAAARVLGGAYEPTILQGALEAVVGLASDEERGWLSGFAKASGLAERYLADLREASGWNERAHAAKLLGQLRYAPAVPALVSTLRDPYEDETTVKAIAAEALAQVRESEAIPLLTHELRQIDEWSSPRIATALVQFGADAVPSLLELLESSEPASLVWAIRVLGEIGDTRATQAISDELGHRNDSVRIAAADALGKVADRRAIQALIQATLKDPATQVRAHAANSLGKIGDEAALGVLIAALGDPDHGTRLLALEALEMIRPPDTSAVERLLRDPNRELARRAAVALERLGYLERKLVELTSDDRETVRRAHAAVLELGRIGLTEAIVGHIGHPDFRVRAYVVLAASELRIESANSLLLASTDDDSWPVRARIAEALGKLRPTGSVPALVKLLADAEVEVREAAAEALGAFHYNDLREHALALGAAFESDSAKIRMHMVGILADAPADEATVLLDRACSDSNERVRLQAVNALAENPTLTTAAKLLPRLSDASMAVRLAAIEALGHVDDPSATAALLRALPGAPEAMREKIAQSLAREGARYFADLAQGALQDADLDVRLGLTWAMGKIGDPKNLPALIRFLQDPAPKLRASAAGALAKIVSSEARDALIAAAEDRDARTRAAAVNALPRQGPATDETLQVLAARLDDPDRFVRHRAAMALGQMEHPRATAALMTDETASRVDPSVLTIALALSLAPEGLQRALDAITQPETLAKLRDVLGREQPSIRRAFLRRVHLDEPVGEELLLEESRILGRYHSLLRGSQNVESRKIALGALSKLKTSRAVETLADAVATDPSEEIRLVAAQSLASQAADDYTAREALARAVDDPSESVALVAVASLGSAASTRHGEVLLRRVGTGSEELQDAVEKALASLYADQPIPLVDRMMAMSSAERMVPFIRVLGRIPGQNYVGLLGELLKSDSSEVRIAVVEAMARTRSADAETLLDEAVLDTHESVRLAVLQARIAHAQKAEDKVSAATSLSRLGRFVKDPSVAVRAELARALASVDDGRTLLGKLAEDLSEDVRAAALASFLAQPHYETLRSFMRLWPVTDPDTRRKVREDARVPQMTRTLGHIIAQHRKASVRLLAVTALAGLEAPGKEPWLVPALTDPDSQVRLAALHGLSSVEHPDVRASVDKLLIDPDERVREYAKRVHLRVIR